MIPHLGSTIFWEWGQGAVLLFISSALYRKVEKGIVFTFGVTRKGERRLFDLDLDLFWLL